ncbi:MAG: hypothetical protein A2266_02600 [Bacteroidetes bacterium RIFOXYA12_FULL_40_10]|nr:MAG: hypothetical protein US49_C0004G0017 [candidate division TM6 bacterium GW2011_GWF2_37_49]OFY89800.1 MAG: hypothetical protein A2266_02600 [Bacteroidetes bacterium RIFOXYA12_FULL_40_10]HBG62239.1 hypothetical protein [Candidatus Omnitrophota bacterium]
MAKIALVDDSNDQRDTFKKRLSIFLNKRESTLEVVDTFPFSDISKYFKWIIDEDIIALILDEKLHIESQVGSTPVDYNGSDLVVKIRNIFKDIPIFTLTNYSTDEELLRNFSQFEYILSKDNFTQMHVDIILRACQRYICENQKQLSLFDDITRKIASGYAVDSDFEILKALQIKLQLPISTNLKDKEDWLREYEKQISALEQIKNDLESKKQE